MDLMSFYAIPPPVRQHQEEVNNIGGNFVYNVYQGAQYQPNQQFYPKGVHQVEHPFTFPQAVAPAQQEEKKFGSLSSHVQNLGVQTVQTAEAVEKQNEVTPTTFCSIVSPKEDQLVPVPTRSQEVEEEAEPKESQNPEKFPWESKRAYKRRLVNKPLPKLEDPGKFVIPVSINGCEINDCLCDTGANVNLMSYALARDLGFKHFKDPKAKMEFAEHSCVEPYGVIENVMLEIGGRLVPTYFQIMVWEGSKRNQLLLGSPFLASAGALIDFMRNCMSLGNIQQDVFYQSIDFKTAPRAIKLPPEKATKIPKTGAMLPKDPKQSEPQNRRWP
ncbi:unnamed protein product [Microthlaspi erraticum]|uniref:Aspartic peptidase DDI1-type domain-containing protein n=1 Tax=Microthlaspi erraticum TaxID=1685480 RepID=A0A6D2I3U7_9BRAS|nr:unnamed protein product [Microthlaspi erraticum]